MHSTDTPLITLAVIDLAGTTADENGAVRHAVLTAVEEVTGRAATPEFEPLFDQSRGRAKTTMLRVLLGDGAEDQVSHAHTVFESELERLIHSGHVRPIAGADTTFDRLHDLGAKVALATGFSAHLRQILLEQLGWTTKVDLALSPEDVGRGRPCPDTVLTAMLALEIDSVRNVAVAGDTVNDLLAGTRAGAVIVAGVLTGAHDRATLETAPHTHIIETIADLPQLVQARHT
ncbi:HAD family hydrolase [Mycolicibacterium sp. YH-1]|uniref:HAD family hydrolase n=1 Tax=Mycolicibacterium sp. YH-1 TaxID=2908837 RepID=UPI001F4BE8B2|nr:HAD family hydrolase [Mycolicibacterium sp. YH-1]UNB52953.1 HAD hydrolase-like protein [Mycolicibacterium sp. YH-1]